MKENKKNRKEKYRRKGKIYGYYLFSRSLNEACQLKRLIEYRLKQGLLTLIHNSLYVKLMKEAENGKNNTDTSSIQIR